MGVCDPFKQELRRDLIQNFFDEFNPLSENKYFLSIGKTTPWVDSSGITNDNYPNKSVDSVYNDTNFWRNILAYKKIGSNDVCLVVPRYDWEPGVIYTAYRDDVDLFDDIEPSKFYVLVDEERVYKCIDNNYDSPSTVAPTHTDPQIRTLSDGYRWKFLYQIPESKRTFLTKGFSANTGYMPVEYITRLEENDDRILQWNVQQAAVDGSIDFISLNETIRSSVISDRVVFPSSENQVAGATSAGSSTVIISGPNLVYTNNYYNNMVFKVESGLGSGQQRVISSYSAGSNTATITLDNPLDIGLTSGTGSDLSLYSILPQVKIEGDGTSNNNTLNTYLQRAEATVKFITSTTGSRYIDTIEVVNSGKNYTFADVIVVAGLTHAPGITADLSLLAKAIISPVGGHGSNPVKELGTSALMVAIDYSQDEDGKVSIDNEFRQFGIIKNPNLYYKRSKLTLQNYGIPTGFTFGDTVRSGTAQGIVQDWYPGLTGVSGTAELNILTKIGAFTPGLTISPYNYTITDVKENTLAGTEGRNLQALKLVPLGTAGTVFNPNGTDFARGYLAISIGNTADSISPSYSTGKIFKWQPDLATNLSGVLYLENSNGPFNTGEYVSQITKNLTSGYTPNIGKITESTFSEEDNLSVYTQNFNLLLNYDGVNTFTSSSFDLDQLVSGYSGSSTVAKGYVVDWTPATGGTQGNILLNGVWGSFATGNSIIYNNSGISGSIISQIVSEPDIRYHTGEVLHIQNIRPVERSIEQREEIKFIVEF